MAERADNDLLAALVKRAQGYQERAPVCRIERPSPEQMLARARSLLADIWPQFGDCSIRVTETAGLAMRMRLPNDGHVTVFPPSGAIAAAMHARPTRAPVAADERRLDRSGLMRTAQALATMLAAKSLGPNEEMRLESTWERKGQGVTIDGSRTPVALFELLAAFRRYLHGLPVLGRASVHASLGGGSRVVRWGIEWRSIEQQPVTHTPVIDPQSGAQRVLDELSWRRVERPFTLEDFDPKAFSLGYLSFSRRRDQFVMQPVWVAVLAPRAPFTMGQVVVVPAAPRAFEPIDRSLPMR